MLKMLTYYGMFWNFFFIYNAKQFLVKSHTKTYTRKLQKDNRYLLSHLVELEFVFPNVLNSEMKCREANILSIFKLLVMVDGWRQTCCLQILIPFHSSIAVAMPYSSVMRWLPSFSSVSRQFLWTRIFQKKINLIINNFEVNGMNLIPKKYFISN